MILIDPETTPVRRINQMLVSWQLFTYNPCKTKILYQQYSPSVPPNDPSRLLPFARGGRGREWKEEELYSVRKVRSRYGKYVDSVLIFSRYRIRRLTPISFVSPPIPNTILRVLGTFYQCHLDKWNQCETREIGKKIRGNKKQQKNCFSYSFSVSPFWKVNGRNSTSVYGVSEDKKNHFVVLRSIVVGKGDWRSISPVHRFANPDLRNPSTSTLCKSFGGLPSVRDMTDFSSLSQVVKCREKQMTMYGEYEFSRKS